MIAAKLSRYRDRRSSLCQIDMRFEKILGAGPRPIHYLYSTGWTLDRTVERHVKSNSDDRMFDLCFFSQTREAWQEWKKAKGK